MRHKGQSRLCNPTSSQPNVLLPHFLFLPFHLRLILQDHLRIMATRPGRMQLRSVSAPFFRSRIRLPQRRNLIPAPKKSTGPLMSRRADRALPKVRSSIWIWVKTMPIFIAVMIASSLALINYEKSCSSIVNSTLYALRHNETGRKELGDEIYFRDKFPWIWGEMNQRFGRINICFGVKGSNAKGLMRFRAERKTRMGLVSAPV